MGGYGAFKLALRKSERFSAAGSFSGALTLDWMRTNKERELETKSIFGEKLKEEDDLLRISQKLAKTNKVKPRLYQSCGTEDFLYQENLKFKKHLEKLGYDLSYSERPGSHEWGFWDIEIQKFLKWLNLK
ncbi:MAG TPA: alpha/beta hydrolase-fold protein, partial [Victivallales bacterium]|nr:alpha/beta hydrolase-fold protein [Victivallales bacterium]